MTLILAQASRWFALQVGDRLVTRAGRAFNRVSNKNVLFRAQDAIVTFGYTGFAYLEGTTTDQWIAEVLNGQAFPRRERPPSLQLGAAPLRCTHIGPALQRLEVRLRQTFAAMSHRADARTMMVEVLGSGWQWSRRHPPRPILVGLRKQAGTLDVTVWRSVRHVGRGYQFAATPEVNLQTSDVDVIRSGLRGIQSPDDAEQVMVRAIRAVSKRLSSVGPDCMSILIPPPAVGWARIRYIPVAPAGLVLRSRSDGRIVTTAPASFSPWVVAPGLVHAPSVLAGHMTLHAGDFTVHLEAPELKGPGLRGAMGSLEPPPEPR